MARPWDISADEIEQWAQRGGSEYVLPKLIARLLWATAPVESIAMRADAGVRLAGWDVLVTAAQGARFCPPGASAWELSVRKAVKAKLDEDFDKRTDSPPPPAVPARTTYVAVTARRFAGKDEWVEGKRGLGRWADVRLYDADDLADWLGQAPAVARWFAAELGVPAGGFRDMEEFLDAWSRRTQPPLPPDLLVAGHKREQAVATVRAWLERSVPVSLHVWGDTRDEAVAFIAAAVTMTPQPGRERWLARALVVESREAWSWVLAQRQAEPMILVPAFDGADPERAHGRAHVLIPHEGRPPADETAGIVLDPVPFGIIEEILRRIGFDAMRARQLAEGTGGKLLALQRECGYWEPPLWARGSARAPLLAMLLAGAWAPQNPGDREAMHELGVEPDEVERLCADLHRSADVAFAYEKERGTRGVYRWRAPAEAWKALASGLTETQLRRFAEVAVQVLGERDPRYGLAKEERFYAAVHGKVRAYSKELRTGLADSLARLSLRDEMLRATLGPGRGSRLAQEVVHRLLTPEWQVWASLAEVLSVLAEAAPEAFLDTLEASLRRGDEGVSHLLAEEGDFRGHHTGLLWALEALGWNARLLPRVALALARLAACDPGGKLSNRPLNSLMTLLDSRVPQTRASFDERVSVLDRIIEREPEIGWKLVIGLIQQSISPTLWPSKRTQYRDWSLPMEERVIDRREVRALLEQVIARADRLADEDASRWAELVRAADALPWDLQIRVLDTLGERKKNFPDAHRELWPALRRRLSLLLRVEGQPSEYQQTVVSRLEALYEFFTPDDFVMRTAWLFASGADVPVRGSHEDRGQHLVERQQQALDELWQQNERWHTLAALAGTVKIPVWVGSTLANMPFADEIEAALIRAMPANELRAIIPGFIAQRTFHEGMGWLEEILKSLLAQDRIDDAVASVNIMAPRSELWNLIDKFGDPLRSKYWQSVEAITRPQAPEDWERAVRNLLEAGRPATALITVNWSSGAVSPETALRVLHELRLAYQRGTMDTPPLGRPLEPYDIERVFEIVDQDPSIDTTQVIELELFFLSMLLQPWHPEGGRSARRLFEAMAESPKLFADVVAMLYRSDLEESSEAALADQARSNRAQAAFHILEGWRGYPGQELIDDDREEELLAWAHEALRKLRDTGRAYPGASEVAKVLARVPHGPDGVWPCRAARVLIQRGEIEDFAHLLNMAKRNLRGVTTRGLGEGGDQERVLASEFRASAERLRSEWPGTAAMLDELAARYAHDAEAEDAEARAVRSRYGMDLPEAHNRSLAAPGKVEPTDSERSEDISAIDWLELRELELSPSLRVDLAPRLNLLTGNNGLGKTLVLDTLFWALTGIWPGDKVWPARDPDRRARAAIAVGWGQDSEAVSRFDPLEEEWHRPADWPRAGAVVLYARLDGGFSLWDPVRNRSTSNGSGERASSYLFSAAQVWEGIRGPEGVLCNGLLDDLLDWQYRRKGLFARMHDVLARLSPGDVPLRLGEPVRLSVHDARDIPTLVMPYGAIPVSHASAAIKRILGLAYLLVWAWHEHKEAARLAGEATARRLVLLIDEVESHLHPRWQRMFLPALFEIVRDLASESNIQILATTHAPLVTASVELLFDPEHDRLFHFDIDGTRAVVEELAWAKQGDAVNWLVSETFGLRQARSREAERAIEAAEAFMRGDPTPPDLDTKEKIHQELLRVLPGHDDFWPRWLVETGAVP